MPIKKDKLDNIKGYREYQARKQEEAQRVSSPSTQKKEAPKPQTASVPAGEQKRAVVRKEKLDAIPQYREHQARQAEKNATARRNAMAAAPDMQTVTQAARGEVPRNAIEPDRKFTNIGGRRGGTAEPAADEKASGLEIAGNAIWKGISSFNRGATSTIALPERLLEKYVFHGMGTPLSDLADYYKEIDENYGRQLEESLEGHGKAARIAADLGVSTVNTLPNTILAILSGGTSAAAQGGAALTAAANTGLQASVANATREMLKNPLYWSSFTQTLGNDYEEAKAGGADDLQAAASALISSALNAGVEIGGGIETLPETLKQGGGSAVKEWVKSMFDEGKEEVIQDIVTGITQKAVYDQDKTWLSTTDEDAVVNPGRLAQDFGMGAAVGGILGGAQTGVVGALNYLDSKRGPAPMQQESRVEPAVTVETLEQAAMELVAERQRAQKARETSAAPDVPPTIQKPQEAPVRASETVEQDMPIDSAAGREQFPGVNRVLDEQKASVPADLMDTLSKGGRVEHASLDNEQFYQLADREDIGVDSAGMMYQMDPAQHISRRTAESAGKRGVNAFQFDHPELQTYYKAAAQQLVDDAALSLDAPKTTHTQRGAQGKTLVTEILDTPSLREAMDMGLSRNGIIQAAEDLIADKGQENNAAAKRLELVLDDMLTNGYTTARGERVEPNQQYISMKEGIVGYQPPAAREPLPIFDMPELEQSRNQAAYDAGKAGVPMEAAQLESDAQVAAYNQGRMESIMQPEKAAETVQKPIEKQEPKAYTGGEENTLRGKLENSSNVDHDGLNYTITGLASGYVTEIRRTKGDKLGGYVTDARGKVHHGGPFDTYQEAVDDLVAVSGNMVSRMDTTTTVTEDEKTALLQYKSSESYKINAKLRYGMELDANEQHMVDMLDSALAKLPKYRGEVYRNLTFDDFGGKEALDEFMSGHVEGMPVKYPSFTSTSTREDGYPLDGEYVAHIVIPDSENARDMVGFGNNFEYEAVYERNATFFVERISYDSKGTPTIYLMEAKNNADGLGQDREIRQGEHGQLHSEERGGKVREMQKPHPVHSDLQGVSEGNPGRTSERGALQGRGTEEVTPKNPQLKIAEVVEKYIKNGKDFTADRLFKIADAAYGGTMAEGAYTVKDAYDGMELAVNRYLMASDFVKQGNGDAKNAAKTLDKLVELLKHIPTQTKRTAEMESYQQFSTPPNIAYLAAWVANVNESDVVLEPSAGIGGLALWPKAWGAAVYGNELSERRLAFLNQLGLDGTFNLNAEQIDNLLPEDIKPSVVLMNPPFSSTAGRTNKNATANAKRHIEQALERLENGGRLVAILGNGMADDAPAFKSWWNELRGEYTVRANIRLDGQNYRKYGTTFDVQLAVIDKTGPSTVETKTGVFKDLSEIPAFMEEIRNEREGTVRNGGAVAERAAVAGADRIGHADAGRAAGGAADVLEEGKRGGKNSVRTSDGKGKRKSGGVRAESQGDGAVVSETAKRGGGAAGRADAGPRMALSGGAGTDSVGAAAVTENPDSVYSTYSPRKVHIDGAKKHPAKLVESAAMAAVEPPDVTYTPSLPKELASSGKLSDAQLENIVYAGQAHTQMLPGGQRKGYFIGDGTGVGKGRQLSGIIMDNFMQGRERAIWVSNSANLYEDAIRDWVDLGGKKDDVLNFSKFKLGQDIAAKRGIMFSTYDTLKMSKNEKSRLSDLERWLGKDFDGVICLDEAHNMANATGKQGKRGKSKPSAKALAGIKLQQMFPKARVVYASATGATDISDYAYLDRLGLWGPGTAFHNAEDFTSKISTGGLAAMELVARDMKSMGVYMARSISYDDVTYDTIQHDLNPMQTQIYNTMSKAWQGIFQNIEKALGTTGANQNGMARSAAWSAFYSTQQRFYNQIITSMSMPSVIEDMRKELENGRSCILQIVNTNAAAADRAIAAVEDTGGSLDDMDLTPTESLVQYLINSFPVQEYEEYTDEKGNKQSRPVFDKDGNPVLSKKAIRQRDALVEQIKQMKVPDGPLEMLFDAFGVDQVAEVTGRNRRVVEKLDENGHMHRGVESRSGKAGVADAQMFQDGKKRILVFSDAGGTGKSYHADKRAKNQQQRVHYLLQPGWNASKATQGFGRSHRSNQACAPIFRLVTTNVMGQKRFTSTIARRLDQLGALTKGQRQAGSGIFGEKDNLEGPIAQDALQQYYRQLPVDIVKKLGLYPKLYDVRTGAFKTEDNTAARDIGMFLNRILALEVDEQNEVFQGFYDTFDRMMDVAISNGTVDMGLENYRADKIEVMDEKVIRKDPSGADTKYVQMQTYHKPELVSLQKAKRQYQNFQGLVRTEDGGVRAVYEISSKTNNRTGEVQRRFKLEGPVKGKTSVFMEDTMKAKTTAIEKADWLDAWKEETAKAPEYNESTLHLLTGTLLPIWDRLPTNNTRVMRVISSDGKQYLGRVIRADQIDSILKSLGANRTMQTYTAQQVSDAVLKQGKEIVFRDNKLRMNRRRVSGEWRMELTGQNIWYLAQQIPGVISERINYEFRYFMPTGNEAALKKLMDQNPVVDIREQAQTGEVDRMLGVRTADHSAEWTADRVGDANVKPKRLSEIIEDIRHDFGLNITTGHIRGKDVRGQYNRKDHGIRSRIANDLPTVAHELGHHFDVTFGLQDSMTEEMRKEVTGQLDESLAERYDKDELLGEGIAEYMRRFLQNRETAAIDYPAFNKHFLGCFTGKDLALIERLADEVNAYYALDADTATSSIRLREEGTPDGRTYTEKIKAKASVLYQAWVDSNQGIKEFDRATGANTYKLASNAAYSDAIAGQIITGDLTDADGQYVSGGLKTALHGLDLRNEEEYRLFGEYLTVKHGPERLREGMRIFADDRKNSSEWMKNRQKELEEQFPQFDEISERLYEFQSDFLKTWGVDTGIVSKKSAEKWSERWAYYVPLNRAVSPTRRGGGAKRGFANQDSTIKKARGSGLEIVHPVDNIVNNIVKMVNAGVRNNVMRSITDAAEDLGADATFLERVPAPMKVTKVDMKGVKEDLIEMLESSDMADDGKRQAELIVSSLDDILKQYGGGKAYGNVITVMNEGKPQFWKINDPQLLTSITNMSPKTMDGVLDAYAIASRFMTSNITGNNIVWSIFSNAPRDAMTFFTYSKNKNPAKMAAAVGSAYLNKVKGDNADPLYKEYLAMGGGSTSAYTADRDLAKRARKSLAGKKFNPNPLDWIAFASDTIESGPRFATYKLMRQAGMDPQEAFYESTDITVNFRRGGRISRELNKIVPFFNANVQGLDKFRRWITAEEMIGKPERKKVITGRTVAYVAASAALAALAYGINNRDEEKEKDYEQLSTYIKNSYWNFPIGEGKYFSIPKPREIAVLSSFFETSMEYGIGENDHAFDEFYAYAAENFLPSIANDIAQIPQKGLLETGMGLVGSLGVVGVVGYLGANRDFMGRPIVSSGLQNLEPKDQYTERTSKIAYQLGQVFGGSPQQIDYFFEQVLGGWWKYQKALFPVGEENRDFTLGVKNSYIKDNQYSTDLVNWLFDHADASGKAKKSDPTNIDKAITAKLSANMTDFYSSFNKQAKNKAETMQTRATRQLVLDMIREYQKGIDSGTYPPTQEAVNAVCKAMNSTEYLPGVMPVSVKDGNDQSHELSDVQYVEFQTDYNRIYWETVEDTLNVSASAKEKAEVLRQAKIVAKEQATARTLARIGAPKSKWSTTYRNVSNEDIVNFEADKAAAKNNDGKLEQAEVVNIISGMRLSNDDRWALYFSEYDGKAAHEAERYGISADLYMTAKIDMAGIKADYKANGKAITGSRRAKIERYLNSVCDTYEQYLFLLGTEYDSVKDDHDYVMFFGN